MVAITPGCADAAATGRAARLTRAELTRIAGMAGFVLALHVAGFLSLFALVAPHHYHLGTDTATGKASVFGVKLAGCPLEEKISAMNLLKGDGVPVGALAIGPPPSNRCRASTRPTTTAASTSATRSPASTLAAPPSPASTPTVKMGKPKRQKAAPQPTEEDVAIVRPRESDDPVVNVLKDMFSIFNSDDNNRSLLWHMM